MRQNNSNEEIIYDYKPKKDVALQASKDVSGADILSETLPSNNFYMLFETILQNQKLIKELQQDMKHLKSVIDRSNLPSTSKDENFCFLGSDQSLRSCSESQIQTKEIGRKGSKVYISEDQWYSAISKSTYTNMGLNLLTATFPLNVLLESNLKGGSSKIRLKDKNENIRKPLDPQKLQAIMAYHRADAVKEKFPTTYNESGLRIANNNKLSSLRKKLATNLKIEQEPNHIIANNDDDDDDVNN